LPVKEPETGEVLVENEPGSREKTRVSYDSGSLTGGLILVVLGLILLADNLIPRFHLFDYWPLILIAIGAGLLWKAGGR
jgi:hypothetical protein